MSDSLNLWIREIETLLSDLSPGERAQAVIELDRQLRKLPLTTYEELCKTYGTPSQVANRYKLQSGKSPSIVTDAYNASPKRPIGSSARTFFKFATFFILAFFGFIAFIVILIPVALFKFFAVDHFDKDFNFTWTNSRPKVERLEGKFQPPLNNLTFTMSNGQVEVSTDPNATEVTYDCEIEGPNTVDKSQAAKVDKGNATIALLNVENADCDITVPPLLPLSMNLTNGRIELSEAEQNVEANLTNGEIDFSASSKATYDMKASSQVGSVDGLKNFEAEQNKKKGPQYSAVLQVGNGRVNLD